MLRYLAGLLDYGINNTLLQDLKVMDMVTAAVTLTTPREDLLALGHFTAGDVFKDSITSWASRLQPC